MTTAATPASITQAFTRFGLGGRPDDIAPTDVMAWLNNQLSMPDTTPKIGLPTVSSGLTSLYNFQQAGGGTTSASQVLNQQIFASFNADIQFNLTHAITTTTPFHERLVWFWANHFAIMAETNLVACIAGAFLRDAIRPYVNGTFSQMLQAAALHPAMLFSLNAEMSVGPLSPTGLSSAKRGRPLGINENLGRELLELYTVGLGAGYSQADVDALAYLLTGADVNINPSLPLGTFYNASKAQPGNFTLLGVTYPGTASGLYSALNALGTSSQTYLHLATKLVTHFVSDTPCASDIQIVYNALARSGGSLPAAHNALISLQNAWIPFQKIKSPLEFVGSALRAVNTTVANAPSNINQAISTMGHPTWQPPFPNGWSDVGSDWVGAEPILLRTDWASGLAAGYPASAVSAAFSLVAPLCSTNTKTILSQQTNAQEQLTLLFCSPEFQRR